MISIYNRIYCVIWNYGANQRRNFRAVLEDFFKESLNMLKGMNEHNETDATFHPHP